MQLPWLLGSSLHLKQSIIILLVLAAVHKPSHPQAQPTPPTLAPPSKASDHLALLSFKSLITSGSALSSWNDSVGICDWLGVTCGNRHSDRVVALSLDSLDLGGIISPSLANLTFLRRLRLTESKLHGTIPTELGSLRRLQYLNLSANFLGGEIPESLSHCSNLKSISLRTNNLEGHIPANLSRCSNLESISLRNNKLTGEIPPELGSLRKLQLLVLGSNSLTGSIPTSFGNLSSLTALRVSYNNLDGSIPSELGRIKGLGLIDVLFNSFSGELPSTLFNFTSLFGLGVGGNHLTGSLPSDFGQNLPSLEYLYLYDNQFHGHIPSSLVNASSLRLVELSNNNFSGIVPSNIGNLANLLILQLGGNELVASGHDGWSFMTSLANCSFLEELDLSNNSLSGSFPDSVANLSSSLQWLRIAGNKMTGPIPLGIGGLSNLMVFDLKDNRLSGSIPPTFGNLQWLQFLSLDINKLSGEIPPSIGNLSKILELYLNENNLSGSIPLAFAAFQVLEILDLSHNNLIGVIPKGVLGISSLSTYLNLSHNSFVGPVPDEVGNLIHLKALDISENKFSGEIPVSLRKCHLLEYLNLQGNNFHRNIPDIGNIKGIQLLDLSRNKLYGPIPSFLESLPLLQFLNLSFNIFEGEVPTQGVFSNSTSFSIVGNENLCSDNPKLNLRACTIRKNGLSTTTKTIVIVIPIVCCLLLISCLAYKCIPKQNSRKLPGRNASWGDQLLKISYAELVNATDRFSSANLIGSGGSSTVYKGFLQHKNTEVAVKIFNQQLQGALKSFMAECKFLRGIRHRNLVRILTSCSSIDFNGNEFRALVYEYMPNGSLETWLHTDGSPDSRQGELSLWRRLNIAMDIASALDYLHNNTKAPIIHCDLKPGNVLLDSDMTAHVTDFGIARFLVTMGETSTVGINGSIGYIAPECGMGSQTSTLWDVYSYGVLLLEVFTGKRPTDETFKDGVNLHNYVEASFPDRVMQVIDPKLLLHEKGNQIRESIYTTLISIMRIALVCSKESQGERMQMQDVVKQLHGVKDALVKVQDSGEI